MTTRVRFLAWLAEAGERAGKTFMQALGAALLTSGAFGLLDASWPALLSNAGLAALLSVLTSGLSAQVGPTGSASLVAAPLSLSTEEATDLRAAVLTLQHTLVTYQDAPSGLTGAAQWLAEAAEKVLPHLPGRHAR